MALKDDYIDLTGFLAGSPEMPLHWRDVYLTGKPTQNEWRSIEHFQVRAREFLLNVNDLRLVGLLSLAIDLEPPRAIVTTNVYPGRHRAKSLYLDFRHFTADREPSKFQAVVNAVSRNIDQSDPIQEFLMQTKDRFIENRDSYITVDHVALPMSNLIDLWFNTEFFHAGKSEQLKERSRWLSVLEEDGAHQLLFWGVINATHAVKCLYACVKDMNQNGGFKVNCPDSRIVLTEKRKPFNQHAI